MSKKKERKKDVFIDLLGLGIFGNDFGRSQTVQFTLASILIVLGIGFLVLAIFSASLFFNLLFSTVLIGSGLFQINRLRKRQKNGQQR